MSDSVIWLPSSPCAGSMYLRFILGNLFLGDIKTSSDLWRVIPPIPQYKRDLIKPIPGTNKYICKTHFLATHDVLDDPRFNVEGFIYLVRNPVDTIASMVNLMLQRHPNINLVSDSEVQEIRQEYVDYLSKYSAPTIWLESNFGTWSSHIHSWLNPSNNKLVPSRISKIPRLVIRFEDLKSTPQVEITKICSFLGVRFSDREIDIAVRKSHFEKTKKIEENEIKNQVPGEFYDHSYVAGLDKGFRIHYRGVSGYGKLQLSQKNIEYIEKWSTPWLDEFNYRSDYLT